MTFRSQMFFLGRGKMLEFLRGLEETADTSAVSLYLPPGLPLSDIECLLDETDRQPLPEEIMKTIVSSKSGVALFRSDSQNHLILPPFPLREKGVFTGYRIEPLSQLLENDYSIALILVHLGTYAIGISRGEKLISSKVGTGLVHGRHRKGGSSQQRFQRRRQNQIQEFLDRVCRHIVEQLEPASKHLDYIVYGGPHHTVLQLQKRCPFLGSLEIKTLPPIDVPALRHRVLETTVGRIWSSSIIEWQDNEAQTGPLN